MRVKEQASIFSPNVGLLRQQTLLINRLSNADITNQTVKRPHAVLERSVLEMFCQIAEKYFA